MHFDPAKVYLNLLGTSFKILSPLWAILKKCLKKIFLLTISDCNFKCPDLKIKKYIPSLFRHFRGRQSRYSWRSYRNTRDYQRFCCTSGRYNKRWFRKFKSSSRCSRGWNRRCSDRKYRNRKVQRFNRNWSLKRFSWNWSFQWT